MTNYARCPKLGEVEAIAKAIEEAKKKKPQYRYLCPQCEQPWTSEIDYHQNVVICPGCREPKG